MPRHQPTPTVLFKINLLHEKINTAIKTVYFMRIYIEKERPAAYCIN